MEQTKYDVFISYSRRDYVDERNNVIPGNVVSKIKEALTNAGISYWFDEEGIYSWWSYRFKAREKNAGWRIDYFLVSEDLEKRLVDAKIHTEIFGSDHCPVELEIQ